ncbi:MAG: hypothetical protein KDC54_03500 [Lewinella sp.]|nr:hypothetical protein [Lewinella sp.]
MTRRLHFIPLDQPGYRVLALLMIACFLGYAISLFGEGPGPVAKIALVLGYLLTTFILGRILFYRDSVTWNRKGISIKLGGFFRKSTDLVFRNIRQVHSLEDTVTIELANGRQHTLDLTGISPADQQRLVEVLTANTST